MLRGRQAVSAHLLREMLDPAERLARRPGRRARLAAARAFYLLGTALYWKHRPDLVAQARKLLLTKAAVLSGRAGDAHGQAKAVRMAGVCEGWLGRPDRSLAHHLEAIRLLVTCQAARSVRRDLADCHRTVSIALAKQDRWQEALDSCEAAARLYRSLMDGADSRQKTDLKWNLCDCEWYTPGRVLADHAREGDVEPLRHARHLLTRARAWYDARRAARPAQTRDMLKRIADTDKTLSTVAYKLGDHEEALTRVSQAIDLRARLGLPEPWVIYHRGVSREKTGDTRGAYEDFASALNLIERTREDFTEEEYRRTFLTQRLEIYGDMVQRCLEDNRLPEAYAWAQRSKARLLNEELLTRQPEVGRGGRRAARPAVAAWERAVAIQPEEVASWLEPDEAFLDFYPLRKEILVFIIRRGGLSHERLKISLEKARELADCLRGVLDQARTGLTGPEAGAVADHLFRTWGPLLMNPLLGRLEGVTHLYIAEAGPLSGFPMEALALEDGEPLMVRFTVSYLSSPLMFKRLHERVRRQDRRRPGPSVVAGVGGDDLPAIAREVETVSRIVSGCEVLSDSAATPEAVLEAAARASVVHLACHAEFVPEKPEASYLQLAPAESKRGRLSLGHVAEEWESSGAPLIVLSGCETGSGVYEPGDEAISLARAFVVAGAGGMVVSLWKVGDEPTELLMREFYGHLRLGPARALRRAMARVREVSPHPWAWAGFRYLGLRNWNPFQGR